MSEPKILIALATFNRPLVTQVCLASLQSARGNGVRLVVYDDASSSYNETFLESHADEVVRFHRNGGIERSRARAFRDFVHRFQEFDLLYLTDNDTVHDPEFVSVLRAMHQLQSHAPQTLPVCLYKSIFHSTQENTLAHNDTFLIQKTAPGVSHCYTREMAQIIAAHLDQNPELETIHGWHYYWPALLHRPFLQTSLSYLEHFARDRDEAGTRSSNSRKMEAAKVDFESDRAMDPTPYLKKVRDMLIDEILGPTAPNSF